MYARHRDEAAGRLDGFEPGREGPGVRETRELYERLSRASSAREPAGTRPVRLPRLSDSSGPGECASASFPRGSDGFAASGSVSYYDGHMPYSYNLRRNRPAAQDSIHTVAQYYPTYSSAASSHAQSPPLGDAHSSTSSAKYFGESAVPSLTPRRNDHLQAAVRRPEPAHGRPHRRHHRHGGHRARDGHPGQRQRGR